MLLRARLIAGVPADLIGSLTGLTEGRFPVYARARYADDLARDRSGALRSVASSRRRDAPVVAVNDGVVRRIGRNRSWAATSCSRTLRQPLHLRRPRLDRPLPPGAPPRRRGGRALGQARCPRTPRRTRRRAGCVGRAPAGSNPSARSSPAAARSARRRPDQGAPLRPPGHARRSRQRRPRAAPRGRGARARLRGLRRLLLPPRLARPGPRPPPPARRRARGSSAAPCSPRRTGSTSPSARPAAARRGSTPSRSSTAGSCSRPPPSTARPAGTSCTATASIGQVLLLPKTALERRVLADERIEIYDCGRDDIRAGRIDRRVLATLAYLAESGLEPTVTSLEVRPRLLHELRQRVPPLVRATRSTSRP